MKTTNRIEYVEKRITDFSGTPVEEEFQHLNDIEIKNISGTNIKDIVFVKDGEAVKNVVAAVVNTCKGELQMDKTAGIPYFENVLGHVGGDLADWSGYMQNAILKTNGVKGISSFTYTVQDAGRNRRELVYSATVKTKYGTETVTNGVQKKEIVKIRHNNLGGQ